MESNGQLNPGYPDWVPTMLREAAVRRGLVLYGNIRDVFYDPVQRQYVTIPELLIRLFTREEGLGFTMAGLWDSADGLRFPGAKMLNRFREVLSRGSAATSTKNTSGETYDVGGSQRGQQTNPGGTGLYANPGELLPAIRTVLESETERPAFVLDWSHLLVTQPAHPDPDERQWILHMGKALVDEPIVPMDSDHLRRNNGLLVLLAANLGSLPPILYQGDPRMHLIAVPPPARPEWRAFFNQCATRVAYNSHTTSDSTTRPSLSQRTLRSVKNSQSSCCSPQSGHLRIFITS